MKAATQPLIAAAVQPYRAARLSDQHWARGKLAHDPMFPALLERRVLPDRARVLDLGCGRGLLAAWLLAAEQLAQRGQWQSEAWQGAQLPTGLHFRGVELDAACAARCGAALRAAYGERVDLIGGDMRTAEIAAADVITLLDVLHYIPHADQERLLDRVAAALPADGLLVARVGDGEGGWRFRFSQFVDRCVASLHSRRLVSTWCRPLTEWLRLLEARGFSVQSVPMSRGTGFANFLLICRPRGANHLTRNPVA